MNLDEVLSRLGSLPPEAQAKIKHDVMEATKGLCWIPNPGPQTEAYFSLADLLLYGGSGGGGKTDLLAGLALTQHKRSLILRKQYTDLGGLTDRLLDIYGSRDGYSGQIPPKLRTRDSRLVEFGAASSLEQVMTWQGRPHDLRGVDEACQVSEAVIRFILGWVRDAESVLGVKSSQRCRAVLATNPPLTAEGEWVIGMFRPWLDITHPNPAKNGELRWFITDPDSNDLEVDGPNDIREFTDKDGNLKTYIPTSRTFIPAPLSSNPFLINTGYQATLDAMPEPMRSAIRDGNFMAAREDDEWQVIPTAWIRAAQQRWRPDPPLNAPMCAMGVDASGGGRDPLIFSPRYDMWFAPIEEFPGKDLPKDRIGRHSAGLIISRRRNDAIVGVDMGGGYGGAIFECLVENKIPVVAHKGSEGSRERTRDRQFSFQNNRSAKIWKFREALDPDQDGGSPIALPPDQILTADLTAPRYEVRNGKICVESKEDVVKRLGRSTDRGDALIISHSVGPTYVTHGKIWRDAVSQTATPKVNRGHENRKRR